MFVDLSTVPAFLIASLVVILTPGVDTFLLLRTSLHQGRGAGLRALLGIHSASAVQMTVVISGLGALITQQPAVLSTLKWIGAAYLLYLAGSILRGLWLARREARSGLPARHAETAKPFTRGFLSNITNPKMLLFSLAFLPQFVGSAAYPAAQLVVLGVLFLALAAVWELAIVLGAGHIADRLRNPRVGRTLDLVSATAFVTISIGLVAG
ncbi:LysE family translocator [Salinifilum aidingensis]